MKLKPCPFCGGEAQPRGCKKGWFVACNRCNCNLGIFYMDGIYFEYNTEQQAIKTWNRRVK